MLTIKNRRTRYGDTRVGAGRVDHRLANSTLSTPGNKDCLAGERQAGLDLPGAFLAVAGKPRSSLLWRHC